MTPHPQTLATLVACAALCSPLAASAHHSSAMFDQNSKLTVNGTVAKFEWMNPHVIVTLDVPNKDPRESTRYVLECSSPNLLTHKGWKINTLKVGDAVTATFHPLKNGKLGGLLSTVALPTGVVMKAW